jgi:hypothetical protein|nr:MAG TPA: hypothetical protein [Caudoviricetes sp.]
MTVRITDSHDWENHMVVDRYWDDDEIERDTLIADEESEEEMFNEAFLDDDFIDDDFIDDDAGDDVE